MKAFIFLLLLTSYSVYGQLTIKSAQDSLRKYHLGTSTYFDEFIGHQGYGARVILTTDSAAAGFGDGDNGLELIKLDRGGKVQWTKKIKKQFEEVEAQCVVMDTGGHFYVFMLNYNPKGYRGGAERVVCFNKSGVVLWEKVLGTYTLLNRPTVSYVRMLQDGRIEMRGHIVKVKPQEGKDPDYLYWEGWLNSKGVLTQKTGEIIDWKNPEWQLKFKPS